MPDMKLYMVSNLIHHDETTMD